jgi:porin
MIIHYQFPPDEEADHFGAGTVLFFCRNPAVAAQSNPVLLADSMSNWLDGPGITGDWGGVRNQLLDRGIDIYGSYTVEVWGNVAGGLKRGAVYTGLLDFGIEIDAEKLLGISDLTFYNSWLWLSGRDASEDLTGNLLTISNIAGFNRLRLFELWAQQSLFDGFLVIRLGQLAADATFTPSEYGRVFLNATFGWPPFFSLNLPGGGPGYPMAVPGVHIDLNPTDSLNLRTAVFQGNPFDQDVTRNPWKPPEMRSPSSKSARCNEPPGLRTRKASRRERGFASGLTW